MKYFDDGSVAYLEREDFDGQGRFIVPVKQNKMIVMLQGNFCGYCTQAKPAYANFARNNPNVLVATIQIDGNQNEQVLGKLITGSLPDYQGVPHYIAFKNGKYIKTHTGGRDERSLQYFANSF